MASFSNKTSISVASNKRSNFSLDSVHVTTGNFMEFSVAKCMELVPNQSVKISHSIFSRLEPLSVPTFGRANIHSRAYFVPFRTLWPAWNDFITDTPHAFDSGNSIPTSAPYILNSVLIGALMDPEYSSTNGATSVNCDFSYTLTSQAGGVVTRYYRFTPKGRVVYKILRSLGYAPEFIPTTNDRRHSALPLLAVAKVYCDWYFPSEYTQNSIYEYINNIFTYNGVDNPFNQQKLFDIFDLITTVCYSPDIFTSAWDKPSGPNYGASSSVYLKDINNGAFVSGQTTVQYDPTVLNGMESNAPVLRGGLEGNLGSVSSLSQFALTALRSLSDYMKRHQIVGSRALDRYLARFGVKLSSEKLNRSIFIANHEQPIDFGDVTSFSDTDGASLGSYAGKGLSYGNNFQFDYSTDEYGMLIIVSSIVPITSYFEGAHRYTKHLSRLDFYTPEFDALGVQAIGVDELYVPADSRRMWSNNTPTTTIPNYDDYVFGFIPRYAEYKIGYDVLSGDYSLNSRNAGKDSWTLFRSLDGYSSTGLKGIVHDVNFVRGLDSNQFNRIFQLTDEDSGDKFNIIHSFNIQTSFPGKKLWDTYEFENEDKSQHVTVDVGGSKSN